MRSSLSREPALDAIRGVAILLVLAFHYLDARSGLASNTGIMHGVGYISGFGWTGVQLFFVLSGFLIGGILIDHRRHERYFRSFYLRRFVRIVPLYALSLLIFGLFYLTYDWRAAGLSGTFKIELPAWSYLTLTQNFVVAARGDWAGPGWLGVTWSLCVEEQFYLALPVLIYFVAPRRLPAVCIAAILAAPVFRTALLAMWPHNVIAPYVLLPGRMDALFLGVLGAWLWRDERARGLIVRYRPAIAMTFLLMTVPLIANLQRIGPFGHKAQTFGFTVISVYFFLAILLAISARKAPEWLAAARMPLCLAGLGAYSIYLFHRPVQSMVLTVLPGRPLLALATNLVLVAALAWASWRFIEAPAIRYGRRAFRYGELRPEAAADFSIDLQTARQTS